MLRKDVITVPSFRENPELWRKRCPEESALSTGDCSRYRAVIDIRGIWKRWRVGDDDSTYSRRLRCNDYLERKLTCGLTINFAFKSPSARRSAFGQWHFPETYKSRLRRDVIRKGPQYF
jgi:hypothetical protein